MLLTVYCVRRDLSEVTFSLQVDADFELHNFRALCELESGIPAAESQIVHAERPLTDNHRSLASYGLKDGDVVILRQKENVDPRPPVQFSNLPRIDFSSIAVPGTSGPRQRQSLGAQQAHPSPREMASSPQGLDNPALLRDMLLANPHELSLLKERNPPLAEALLSGDLDRFSRVLVEQQQDRARREQERIRLFSADPFDLEAQAKIEEDIRQQNIEENMTIAMEEAPESFGQVVMLYINCKVNGHPVKAFVDSGAQMTIMSQACAERCNIMRLVDRRWAGIAKGVGTQKIIGRVHLAQVQIEGDFLACSFSILEEQPMDMLLGLDMLKRHQCSIDLKKNVLVIGTTGSQTTFLPEGELPECARLAYGAGREDLRPEEIADRELAEAIQKSAEEAEKSGKESTSLGMSSLPTSDGFNHPAPSLGRSPETDSPPSLAHSVSASVCPIKPSDPDSIEPTAVKTVKASAEYQVNSKEKDPLSPQDLPELASSADQTPVMPLHNSSEGAVITDTLQKSEKNTQGREFYLHTRQEASVSVTATTVHEPLTFVDEKNWPPENQNQNQVNCLQQYPEPGSKQREVAQQRTPWDGGHLCNMGDLELREESHHDQPKLDDDRQAAVKGAGHQENALPGPGCFRCSDADIPMEVDMVEQSLVTVLESAGHVSIRVRNTDIADLASDSLSMEVEPSKQDPSLGSLNDSISTQDLQPIGSNTEMSGTNREHGSYSPSSSCQPSIELEESCSSVTAALKELHELLVISSKPASESASEEMTSQSETIDEHQASIENLSEKWTQCEPLAHHDQCLQASCHQTSSVSVKTGNLGLEDGENTCFGGPGGDQSAGKEGVCRSRGSVSERSSDTVTSAKSSNQLHRTLGVVPGEGGERGTFSQTSEQTKSLPSGFILVKDLGQCRHNPATARPETTRPFLELEPPASQSSSSPSTLTPFIFPAADIDRILRAGFTLQEALGALHRVGGNVDLALLVLLAKNIVVPT